MQEVIKYFESLEARLAAQETRIAALEAQVAELQTKSEQYETLKLSFENHLDSMEEHCQMLAEHIATLSTEREELLARIDEFEGFADVDQPEIPVTPEIPEIPEPIIEPTEPAIPEIPEEPATPEPELAPEPEPEPTPEPVPEPDLFTEEPVSPKAALYGKPVEDIRQAISLGDRFLYQRELFAQNAELMQRTLTELNTLGSFDEAVAYITTHFTWDPESNSYQQFLVALHRRFG